MKKFRVPAGVQRLIIVAGMDKHSATGQAAAFECARANLLAKNNLISVAVRWPDSGDFNDMLLNGDHVRELNDSKKKLKRIARSRHDQNRLVPRDNGYNAMWGADT